MDRFSVPLTMCVELRADVVDIVDATEFRFSSQLAIVSGDSANVRQRRICSGPTGVPAVVDDVV